MRPTKRVTHLDHERERQVQRRLALSWDCVVLRYEDDDFAPFDFTFMRHDKPMAVGELKARSHKYGDYPTVYLSERKYKALMLAHDGGLVPLFIVQYLDRLMYIDVSTLTDTSTTLAGRTDRTNATNDIEPMIEVPITLLQEVPQ